MLTKTYEISLRRFYIITGKICYSILFCFMLSISILIYKMCLNDKYYDGYHLRSYIRFIIPHILNLFITVFVIVLFVGDIILIDKFMRFTTDTVIIFVILSLIYNSCV